MILGVTAVLMSGLTPFPKMCVLSILGACFGRESEFAFWVDGGKRGVDWDIKFVKEILILP